MPKKNKFLTSTKYSFPSEFEAQMIQLGRPIEAIAKMLGRDVRTIKRYLDGTTPIPAWTVRLMLLESRYMDALYGLQVNRMSAGKLHRYTTWAANADRYSTQMELRLVS